MTWRFLPLVCALPLIGGGCGGAPYLGSGGSSSAAYKAAQMDTDKLMAKTRLMQEVMNEPDLPAWHSQREKLTLALGDRVFDKDFNRVFDSLTVALASMEARVNNMERQSGYITANAGLAAGTGEGAVPRSDGGLLPPKGVRLRGAREAGAVRHDRCGSHVGHDEPLGAGDDDLPRPANPTQTKVKIRFDHLYYPRLVEEHCCPN